MVRSIARRWRDLRRQGWRRPTAAGLTPADRQADASGPEERRGLLAELVFLAAPTAAALAGAAAWGGLSVAAALLASAVAVLAALGLGRWRLGDMRRWRAWLATAEATQAGEQPPPVTGSLALLAQPAANLARSLADRDRQLEQQGRRLATIVAALPDPVLLVDRRLSIRLANPAADRTFGLALQGHPLGRALRDPGVLAAVNAALATGSASNVTFAPPGDRTKQFGARVAPIEFDGESGALLALREQTEQVLIERMRSDFVANASHEIRTPLAAIIGIVETLQGPAHDDAEAREMFLATLAGEASRMQRLVEDLLSLSRIELAAHRPPENLIEPGGIAEDVLAKMRPIADRARVTLDLVLEPDLPPVRADPDQLHQLLGNLVDNAIKYGGPEKPVRVAVARLSAAPPDAGPMSGRPCLAFTVADQGEGIAAEHIPRITERFYRVDKARSRRVGGTGLGLAIVKHIVRRHQGHLLVESAPGQGSRFTVLLPLGGAVTGSS